ncbi:MAG TPA: heavy metal-binding domain-containing protein [Microlunatus sp.]|nr:heavy metal-binding domain-containing protein [Microlunatus sp.]
MTNYGQQPPNPYQQNPYGQQPPYPQGQPQQGQPQQGPYGQPVQYGQRPQYGQPPAPGQPPQGQPNPYGQPQQPPPYPQQPNPYGEREYRQPPPQQPGQQGPWVAQTPARPTVVPRSIPVVTLDTLPGREIDAVVGDVLGVVARGRDLPPELRGGGMEAGYVSMLTRSRQDAVARAVEMAESAGADAIVGLRFDCSEITQNLSEVVAYGTAVTLVPLPGDGSPADSAATPVSAASAAEPGAPSSDGDPSRQGSSGGWPAPEQPR